LTFWVRERERVRVREGGRGFVGFLVFDHSLWRKFHLEVWDLRNMFLSFYYYYYLDRGILRRDVHF
jgi:hypothetical protein